MWPGRKRLDFGLPVFRSLPKIVVELHLQPEAYQRLLDVAASADAEEGIRQGLDDVAHGRTRPARDVFDGIRRKQGIPR